MHAGALDRCVYGTSPNKIMLALWPAECRWVSVRYPSR